MISSAHRWFGDASAPRSTRGTVSASAWLAGKTTFGEFHLDATRRSLIRGSEVKQLPERLFGVLSLLVRANGAVVDKETFASVVWPDVVMTDANLAQHVYQLRRLLGETRRTGTSIVAASGRGYRLTHPIPVDVPLASGELEPLTYYAQGSQLLARHSARALKRAIELFDAALEIDPNYAPALVGVARAYALLAENSFIPAAPAFASATEAVTRALELSPDLSLAHAARSELLAFGQWNWPQARCEIDAALQLEPDSAFVHGNAARLHICTGSYDRAAVEAKLALMSEPSSSALLLLLVNVFIHSGCYRNAIAILSSLLEVDSTIRAARRYRAQAYLFSNRPADAIVDLHFLPAEHPDDFSGRLPLLARAFADSGDLIRAAEIYSALLDASRTEYVSFWNLAIVATGLGKLGEAMEHLEKALQAREPMLPFLKSLPWFKPLSQLRRFGEILRIVG